MIDAFTSAISDMAVQAIAGSVIGAALLSGDAQSFACPPTRFGIYELRGLLHDPYGASVVPSLEVNTGTD